MKYFFSKGNSFDPDTGKKSGEISVEENMIKEEKVTLLHAMKQTRVDLETAYAGLDYVTDPDLIDCYIYQVNSALKRYKYLTQRATELNLLPEKLPDYAKNPLFSPLELTDSTKSSLP